MDPRHYYAQAHIAEEIVRGAKGREVGIRYETGFGRRPDIIQYPQDVIELGKQGATSFHISEEHWRDPMVLDPGMSRKALDEERVGWDLVFDVDVPHFGAAKALTHCIIRALYDHGISGISVKFSGNKGFHVGLGFQSLPDSVGKITTTHWFPEGAQRIAAYLMDFIERKYITISGEYIVFDKRARVMLPLLQSSFKTPLMHSRCKVCGRVQKRLGSKVLFLCPRCEYQEEDNTEYKRCPKCEHLMERHEQKSKCACGSESYREHLDVSALLKVDTVLISSRHLYRAAYSLHEKSGLVSLPIKTSDVLIFHREQAQPEKVKKASLRFLDPAQAIAGEAGQLVREAVDFQPDIEEEKETREWELPDEAIGESMFPPCIKAILRGVKDGRKRSLFVLIQFLRQMGWGKEEIDRRIKLWNNSLEEPLKEQIITGQLRYHLSQKPKLPPNCGNEIYYEDIGVCQPDGLCRYKNPVKY
jgi:hypothetical protein